MAKIDEFKIKDLKTGNEYVVEEHNDDVDPTITRYCTTDGKSVNHVGPVTYQILNTNIIGKKI